MFESILKNFGLILTRKVNSDPQVRLDYVRSLLLAQCELVIDVGANQGQWARKVRETYFEEIVSVEPDVESFIKMREHFSNDRKWLGENKAVHSKKNKVLLKRTSNNSMSSSLYDLSANLKNAAPDIIYLDTLEIPAIPLSKVLVTEKKNIYIKIDTQGSELEVLKSIKSKQWKQIFALEIELSLVETYKEAPLIEEILTYARAKGFSPYRVENGFGAPNFGQQLQIDCIFLRSEELI